MSVEIFPGVNGEVSYGETGFAQADGNEMSVQTSANGAQFSCLHHDAGSHYRVSIGLTRAETCRLIKHLVAEFPGVI